MAPSANDFRRNAPTKAIFDKAVGDGRQAVIDKKAAPGSTALNDIIGGAVGDLLQKFATYWTEAKVAEAKEAEAARVAQAEKDRLAEQQRKDKAEADRVAKEKVEKDRLLKEQKEQEEEQKKAKGAGAADAARKALATLFNAKPKIFTYVPGLKDAFENLSAKSSDEEIDTVLNGIVTVFADPDKKLVDVKRLTNEQAPLYIPHLVTLTGRTKDSLDEALAPLLP
jgi:hypothetical protein